jgi:ankyrin repeat protein
MSGFVYGGKFKRDDDELARVFENAPRTGETGLIAAAARGDLDTVIALIANGVDVRCHDNESLLWAAFKGREGIVRHLLASGADVHENAVEPLAWAATHGSLEIVKLLVEAGADVNGSENAPLTGAAAGGHNDVVEFLRDRVPLGAGANPTSGPQDGRRPLRSAAERGHTRIVKQLLAAGAPPDQDSDWPLMEASGNGHSEIVRLLLKAGAHANAEGGFALHLAWTNGYQDIVKLLTKAGARWPGGGPPIPREGTSHTSMDAAMAKLLWNPSKQTRQ